MGAANILQIGNLRIAGMSGIYKRFDYRKPHHERLPYTPDDTKSAYHVRSFDVRKLLHVRSQVDVGLSHDWPHGMEWLGDYETLFNKKRGFREDAEIGRLGSEPATYVLDWLRPPYWFSGHMHYRYTAIKEFTGSNNAGDAGSEAVAQELPEVPLEPTKNEDEIDLDMDDDEADAAEIAQPAVPSPESKESKEPVVEEELRAQLPASFQKATGPSNNRWSEVNVPRPSTMSNTSVDFLALDKITPGRDFLQLLEISPNTPAAEPSSLERPLKLCYDPEWLAITRAFSDTNPTTNLPMPSPSSETLTSIDSSLTWVQENITSQSKLTIPENFELTAPVYNLSEGIDAPNMPREYNNPQTIAFCSMLEIKNFFHAPEDEQLQRQANAPAISKGIQRGGFYRRDQDPDFRGNFRGGQQSGFGGRGRGGHRGNRGGSRGRGRGGFDRGRGRGSA